MVYVCKDIYKKAQKFTKFIFISVYVILLQIFLSEVHLLPTFYKNCQGPHTGKLSKYGFSEIAGFGPFPYSFSCIKIEYASKMHYVPNTSTECISCDNSL